MADVIVAGSINMDVVASVARHPLPGETVAGTDLRHVPGGKGANQAVAAVRAGATVRLVGAVGDDAFGDDLTRFLEGSGVDVGRVRRLPGVSTGVALIAVDADGQNTIVVVPGANAGVDAPAVRDCGAMPGDVLVAQYEIPPESVVAFFAHGRDVGATCVLNPAPAAPAPAGLLALVDVLVVNETELATLSGTSITAGSPVAVVAGALRALREQGLAGSAAAVVTRGAQGVVALLDDRTIEVAGHEVRAVDATGAGDCFVGWLAARLAAGSPVEPALEQANAAAALCVTRPGAGPSMPSRPEVEQFRSRRG